MSNTVWSLKDVEGREVSNFDGLANLRKNHFEILFHVPNETYTTGIITTTIIFPRFVQEEESSSIMEELSDGELKSILYNFQNDKIIGLDGWIVVFFLGLYDIISNDLLLVIKESRKDQKIISSFNSTFIEPIPKVYSLHSFVEFWPILLCNVI